MDEAQVQFVISIMSRDRVGIIYEVSKSISELEGNIADIRQSVLCGYFTMILLASFPHGVTMREIERKLAGVDANSETRLNVMVEKVEAEAPVSYSPIPDDAYVLTATGKDKIGFVAAVTSFCVEHKINILDLSTTVSEGEYIMILVIDLQHCESISQVRKELDVFKQKTGLKIVLQHYDIFRAVSEINLPLR
jgi:predicted amino acid-binding ACT domain protein